VKCLPVRISPWPGRTASITAAPYTRIALVYEIETTELRFALLARVL